MRRPCPGNDRYCEPARRQSYWCIGVIVDRSGGQRPDYGCPFVSLIEMNVETFAADNLPSDLAQTPAIKPGSK